MQIDNYKTLGYGTYLDWRWRQGVKRLPGLESATTVEEYYAGPDEEVLLSDKTMVEFLFPCLKQLHCPGSMPEVPQHRMDAFRLAVLASQDELSAASHHIMDLEAGVLAGRPLGDLVPGLTEFTPLAQIIYEQLFFDVRYLLDKPEVLCRLLLKNNRRMESRDGYDWYSMIMAYGLKFEEYSRWRRGESSAASEAIRFAIDEVTLYLDWLEQLGRDRHEDFLEAQCRLFTELPMIIATRGGSVATNFKRGPYTREEIDVAIAMIPDEPVEMAEAAN